MQPLRLLAAVLAAVVLLAAEAGAQFGPTPVTIEPVEQRRIRRTVEIVGTAEARRRAVIGAEVAGRVQTMEADAGDYLKTDGVLCQMRTRPVRLQWEQAEARLASARADLAKMEAGYRKEDIAQASARVSAARAEFARWKQEHERTKTLLADGASTQAEMDATEAAYRTAQEKLAEAQAGLALLKAGYRTEDVAKARAEVAAQAAAAAELADTLEKMTVRMPFAGFVVRKMCEVGEWLSPGSPVAEIVDLGVVRVQLDVPERHLAALSRGATAPVTFAALGEDRQFDGTISQVVPASAEGTHTVSVRVDVPNEIANERPAIAAGLMARVWLPVGAEHEARLVPKAAVIRQQGRDLVYTVQDEPPASADAAGGAAAGTAGVKYAVRIPVKMIGGYGRFMEVESDRLKPGTPVVTRGTYLMEPGAPVRPTAKEKGKGPREPDSAESDGEGGAAGWHGHPTSGGHEAAFAHGHASVAMPPDTTTGAADATAGGGG